MADLQTALHARLTALLGHRRIYPVTRPQKSELPCIVYQGAGGLRTEHLKGYDGMRSPRIQFSCLARSYIEAEALAETVVSGLSSPATVLGVRFGRGHADEPVDGGGDDTPDGYIHRVRVDLRLDHKLT